MRFYRIFFLCYVGWGGLGRLSFAQNSASCEFPSKPDSQMLSFYEDNPTYIQKHMLAPLWESSSYHPSFSKPELFEKGEALLQNTPSSLSLLLLHRGKLIFNKYYNQSAANHSNNVHSVSKSILATLVGIALERGELQSVGQTVGELLPTSFDFKDKSSLTLHQLLSMTTGLQWTEDESEYEIEDHPNWIQAILNLPLVASPQPKFNYSTGVTHLLSALLSHATGVSTCQYAKQHLFKPLGIEVAHWGRDPQGYFSGGCNLYLTPYDLMKLGQTHLNGGLWEGKRIWSLRWNEQMWSLHAKVDGQFHYGYLWWISQSKKGPIYTMWGFGGQFVFILPEVEMVVVMTHNTQKEYREFEGHDFLKKYILEAL